MTAGEMIGDVNDVELAPPDDTGETVGHLPSNLTVSFGFGPGLFERRGLGLGGEAAGGAAADPGAARRRAQPGGKRRRHLRPGLLRRSPGRLPRDPQPGPDRPRHGGDALVPARLRPHRQHHPRPGHPAQPDGLQGRHGQHQGRGHRGDGALRLGRRRRAGLDARRHLHGHPPHPHAAGDLGPLLARRPGADDRPRQVQRRPARRRRRVRAAAAGGEAEPAGCRRSRSTPTSASPRPRLNDGERILRRGYSFTDGVDESLGELEAGLFFIAFQRDPEKQFVAIQRRLGSEGRSSTSTSSTSAAPSSPSPRARARAATSARPCSAEHRRQRGSPFGAYSGPNDDRTPGGYSDSIRSAFI